MNSPNVFDLTFARASAHLGRPEKELRAMAEPILATILHHCLNNSPQVIWTAAKIHQGKLSIETNIPPRPRAKLTTPNGKMDC